MMKQRIKKRLKKLFNDNLYALTGSTKNSVDDPSKKDSNTRIYVVRNRLIDQNEQSSSQLIGFVKIVLDKNNCWCLQYLAVNDKYRRQGVGGSLLDYAILDVMLYGYNKVKVVVPIDNLKAKEFFNKKTCKNLEITNA